MFRSPVLVSKPSFETYMHLLDNRFRDSSALHAVFVGIVELLDSRLGFAALLRAILIDIFPEPSYGPEGVS